MQIYELFSSFKILTNFFLKFVTIMDNETKMKVLQDAYAENLRAGKVRSKREFAVLYGINPSTLSSAMNGDERYLTDSLIQKVMTGTGEIQPTANTIPILPVEAMAGTLVEFFSAVKDYDCERMISPIKGADYAIKVYGDSMSPEIPSGSVCLIKRVDEKQYIAWNEMYVLDTDNGAVVKKIRKTDRDGVVECVSINPSYQSFTIETRFIHGWYRVLMVMSVK